MRDIKLRAWDKKNKRWYRTELEWKEFSVFGELMYSGLPDMNILPHLELQLYSGVEDKNGKEVCEGDIHSERNNIDGTMTDIYMPVVFDNGAFWIDESFNKDGSSLYLLCEYNDAPLNIVGNIHENPELL